MNKITKTYSLKPETYKGLKQLAALGNCTMSAVIDTLVTVALQQLASNGNQPQPPTESETPPTA